MQIKRLSYLNSGIEPVSLDEAKRQCFVTGNDDDGHIARLIVVSREYAEKELWRAITPASYLAFSDEFPSEIELPYPPLISVDSIQYINTAGTLTTLDASEYEVDDLGDPARIKPVDSWPELSSTKYNAVRVTYKAGYIDNVDADNPKNTAPDSIRHAILMMVKHFYDNPEAVIVSGGSLEVFEVPKGVDALLNQESARTFV